MKNDQEISRTSGVYKLMKTRVLKQRNSSNRASEKLNVFGMLKQVSFKREI